MELTIYEEFRDLVPLAQSFEYEQLKENILRDGCTTPLDVWPHDGKQIIIDGHTRYKICRECGVDFSVREINFVDAEEAKIWIIKNQFGRRNLIPYQRAELVLVLEPLIAKKAKERQIAAQNNKAGRAVRENSREQVEGGRTDESLAKISGISSNSIRRAKVIKEHGTPEQIERARTGGRGNTINAIYTEIRHRDISEKTCPMCGETLPIDRFYGEGATCKTCTEKRKQEMLKRKPTAPKESSVQETTAPKEDISDIAIEQAVQSMHEVRTETVQPVDILLEDLECLTNDFCSKVRRSLQTYSTSLQSAEDRSVASLALESAIENIQKIRRLLE